MLKRRKRQHALAEIPIEVDELTKLLVGHALGDGQIVQRHIAGWNHDTKHVKVNRAQLVDELDREWRENRDFALELWSFTLSAMALFSSQVLPT